MAARHTAISRETYGAKGGFIYGDKIGGGSVASFRWHREKSCGCYILTPAETPFNLHNRRISSSAVWLTAFTRWPGRTMLRSLPQPKNGYPKWSRRSDRATCARVITGRVVQTASVCGRRAEVERRRSGARAQRHRRATDGSERVCGVNREHSARDERGLCGTEQAWSRGGSRAETSSAWSEAKPALVTADLMWLSRLRFASPHCRCSAKRLCESQHLDIVAFNDGCHTCGTFDEHWGAKAPGKPRSSPGASYSVDSDAAIPNRGC